MPKKGPGPSVKDARLYEALRNEGIKKKKAARIANAAAATSRHKVATKGGRSPSYEEWSKADLLTQARKVGIKGRSSMRKPELIAALRAG